MKRIENSRSPAPRDLVLYIEDDPDNYDVANLRLGQKYDMLWAKTAEDACRLLAEHGPKLAAVLMDIQLAGSELDGIQLTKMLRGKLPKTSLPEYAQEVPVLERLTIIYVTAFAAAYSEEALLRSGGDRVINKPVDFGALNLALANVHLDRARRGRG